MSEAFSGSNRDLLAVVAGLLIVSFVGEAVIAETGLVRGAFYPLTFTYLYALFWPLPITFLLGRLKTLDGAGRYVEGRAGWRQAWTSFRTGYLTPAAVLRALVAGLAVCLIINMYGSWKRIIPRLVPFSWDQRFADVDRWLHFGVDPWRLLHPLLQWPGATVMLDTVYATWHPVLALMLAWQAWSRRGDLRRRFFLGLVFVWVGLGMIMATTFSSAGPCYYAMVVPGADPFAPLMDHLRAVATPGQLLAVQGQDLLRAAYERGLASPYTGISAMPSLHVAMPALYTALAWERWRPLGVAFAVYTLLTLIGSVHLGWHYAVDGYVGIAAVALYWKLSRRFVSGTNLPDQRQDEQRQDEHDGGPQHLEAHSR